MFCLNENKSCMRADESLQARVCSSFPYTLIPVKREQELVETIA